VPLDAFVPSLCFPIVLYMSLHDHNTSRGVLLSFVIGYLMDAFAGSPIGLYTFVTVAIFLFSRIATLKLFLHGWIFEITLTFLLGLLSSFFVLIIRAVFDEDFSSLLIHIKIVVFRAGAGAVVAPFVFKIMNRIEKLTPHRRGEGIIGRN
jgi:rod shape-determining protein MreD